MKKYLLLPLLTLCLCLFATSCNSESEPSKGEELFYDFATLKSYSEETVVFTIIPNNDDPEITLSFPTPAKLRKDDVEVGTRYLIAYITSSGQAYVSGTGILYGLRSIYNSVISEGPASSLNTTFPQNLMSIWRSGNWINIQTEITYSGAMPKKYELVVDEGTLDNDYPQAYVLYDANQSDNNAVTQLFYATFNISSVWDRPNVKGLKISVMAPTAQTFTFDKPGADVIQPID